MNRHVIAACLLASLSLGCSQKAPVKEESPVMERVATKVEDTLRVSSKPAPPTPPELETEPMLVSSLQSVQLIDEGLKQVHLCPDNRHLVVVDEKLAVSLWDLPSASRIFSVPPPAPSATREALPEPQIHVAEDRWLALDADNQVWDLRNGRLMFSLGDEPTIQGRRSDGSLGDRETIFVPVPNRLVLFPPFQLLTNRFGASLPAMDFWTGKQVRKLSPEGTHLIHPVMQGLGEGGAAMTHTYDVSPIHRIEIQVGQGGTPPTFEMLEYDLGTGLSLSATDPERFQTNGKQGDKLRVKGYRIPNTGRDLLLRRHPDARIMEVISGGEETRLLVGHSSVITSATQSPNGTLAVTTSTDGEARFWIPREGLEIPHPLFASRVADINGFPTSITLSSHASFVVIGRSDGAISLLPTPTAIGEGATAPAGPLVELATLLKPDTPAPPRRDSRRRKKPDWLPPPSMSFSMEGNHLHLADPFPKTFEMGFLDQKRSDGFRVGMSMEEISVGHGEDFGKLLKGRDNMLLDNSATNIARLVTIWKNGSMLPATPLSWNDGVISAGGISSAVFAREEADPGYISAVMHARQGWIKMDHGSNKSSGLVGIRMDLPPLRMATLDLDQKWLATLRTEEEMDVLELWNYRNGRPAGRFVSKLHSISAFAFHLSSNHLMVGHGNGRLDRHPFHAFSKPISIGKLEGRVLAIAFTPDKARMLTSNEAAEPEAWFWDTSSFEQLGNLPHVAGARAFAFHEGSLASLHENDLIRIWAWQGEASQE